MVSVSLDEVELIMWKLPVSSETSSWTTELEDSLSESNYRARK